MHFYVYADCKTPGCQERQILHHDEFDPADAEACTEASIPNTWAMRCSTCDSVHKYSVDDVLDFQSDEAPPPGFCNKF